MILAALILAALPQQENPAEHNPEAHKWWEKLSTEERKDYRRRNRAMHDAVAEAQKNLSAEEIEKINKLDEPQRREYLHKLISKKKNGAESRRRPHLSEQDHKLRQKKVADALVKAEEDGWIGSRTAAWLKTASDSEKMQVLLEVRKWQFLEKADKDGFWKSENIAEGQKDKLIAMPAEQFFLEIRAIIGGKHKMRGGERQKRRQSPPHKSSKKRNGQ